MKRIIQRLLKIPILKKPSEKKEEEVFLTPPLPSSVYLELTNFCNLQCLMCTFHSPCSPFLTNGKPPRKRGFMDKRLALKIVDELGEGGIPLTLSLHGAGESLLYRDLTEVIAAASQYPQINVGFLTNATLLDAEMSKKLLDAGIKWISFSIDGSDPEVFALYRRGATLEKVQKNVMTFLKTSEKLGIKPLTQVNMTVQEEMWGQVEAFVDFWLSFVDRVSISPCRPMGSRRSSLVPPEVKRIPCPMLFSTMVVYWDGEVGLCCEDWFNEGKMGNTNSEGIASIWRGKRFAWARKMHIREDYSKVPLCGDCDIWFNGIAEVSRDDGRKRTIIKNAWQWEYRKDALQ
ncbi:MAG: radical SAM protein [Syntrophobacterales bacterium]|nr:radical SAM protein [Syntrophobacterales bacterium]